MTPHEALENRLAIPAESEALKLKETKRLFQRLIFSDTMPQSRIRRAATRSALGPMMCKSQAGPGGVNRSACCNVSRPSKV